MCCKRPLSFCICNCVIKLKFVVKCYLIFNFVKVCQNFYLKIIKIFPNELIQSTNALNTISERCNLIYFIGKKYIHNICSKN